MNRQRVLNIIREPLRMEHEKDLPLIKELIEEFPYFSAPYILLTKLLSEQKSIYLDKYLKLSASYIGNREVLYNLVHAPMLATETVAPDIKAVESPQEEISVEENTAINSATESISTENHIYHSPEIASEISQPKEVETSAHEMIEAPEIQDREEAVSETDENIIADHKALDEVIIESPQDTDKELVGDVAHVAGNVKVDEVEDQENFHITEAEKIPQEQEILAQSEEADTVEEVEEELAESIHLNNEIENAELAGEEHVNVQNSDHDEIPVVEEKQFVEELPTAENSIIETSPTEETSNIEENSADNISVSGAEKEVIAEIPSSIVAENELAAETENVEEIENQTPKKRLDLDLGLPPLAAYDYFAFQEKSKPKLVNAEPEVLESPMPVTEDTEPVMDAPIHLGQENKNKKTLRFGNWLQSLSTQETKPLAEITEIKNGQEPVKIEIQPEIIQQKPKLKPERKPKKNDVEDLISRFIQSEPRIKPKPTKFFTPQDVAERSAEEDNTLATETLANIYLKQGLNEKAVEIFKQLILKYPQKSRYFADKINEINTNP